MRAGACSALLLLLATQNARAEPTLWQRALDPQAETNARARFRAEQLFEQVSDARADPEATRDLALGTAALLELSGGARRDPWQAVLLGRLLLSSELGRTEQAMQLIESGLSRLPDSEFKRQSWFDLGVAALRGGQRPRAEHALSAALALAWDSDDRSITYRNRARTRMLSGQLLPAIADFRNAVTLARSSDTLALGHFGLGVALERSGDYLHGMQEVARGVAIRLPVPPYPSESVLDWPELIWTPEYEVHYVRALSAMSQATRAASRELEQQSYAEALASWQQYLPAAEAQNDRFLPNARRHEKRCTEALARLTAAARSGRVR